MKGHLWPSTQSTAKADEAIIHELSMRFAPSRMPMHFVHVQNALAATHSFWYWQWLHNLYVPQCNIWLSNFFQSPTMKSLLLALLMCSGNCCTSFQEDEWFCCQVLPSKHKWLTPLKLEDTNLNDFRKTKLLKASMVKGRLSWNIAHGKNLHWWAFKLEGNCFSGKNISLLVIENMKEQS
jgi:hypothetical protein